MFSISLYLRRNIGKATLSMLLMAIGVAGALIISSIFGSFGDTRAQMFRAHDRMVTARLLTPIDMATLSSVEAELVQEVSFISLGYNLLGAAEAGFTVFGPSNHELPHILDDLGLEIVQGRLPENPREIVLPISMLKASGRRVGHIWDERNPYLSTGDYLIVGALSGESWAGFMHPETTAKTPQMILLLGDGTLIEQQLASLLGGGTYISGPTKVAERFRESYSSFIFISLGSSTGLAIMITAALILLSREEFKNRRSELGVLNIIGYPLQALYWRSALELGIKMFGGWGLGVLLGSGLVSLLDSLMFAPAGMVLTLGITRVLPSLVMPVLVSGVNMLQLTTSFKGDAIRLLDSFANERQPAH